MEKNKSTKSNNNVKKQTQKKIVADSDSESNEEVTNSNVNDKSKPLRQIQSYCRIRPFEGVNCSFFKYLEQRKNESPAHTLTINKSSTSSPLLEEFTCKFNFDYIFDEEFTQIEVFQESCLDKLSDFVDKKMSTAVICQGLKNSGKSYTILGDSNNPGILPLSLRVVFDKIKEKKNDNYSKLFCSYIEFYKGEAYDLLSAKKDKTKWFTLFRLDEIEDCSKALNHGNKRRLMENTHSMSIVAFKITLRTISKNKKTYSDCSFTLIDMICPDEGYPNSDKRWDSVGLPTFDKVVSMDFNFFFFILKNIKTGYDTGKKYWHLDHKITNPVKLTKFEEKHCVKVEYTEFTKFMKFLIYSKHVNLVLITNLNPCLKDVEGNLKALNFAQNFVKYIGKINAKVEINFPEELEANFTSNIKEECYGKKKLSLDDLDGLETLTTNSVDNNINNNINNKENLTNTITTKIESVKKENKNKSNNNLNSTEISSSDKEKPQDKDDEVNGVSKVLTNLTLVETELDKMKKDYKNLILKFEAQEKLINSYMNKVNESNTSSKMEKNNNTELEKKEDKLINKALIPTMSTNCRVILIQPHIEKFIISENDNEDDSEQNINSFNILTEEVKTNNSHETTANLKRKSSTNEDEEDEPSKKYYLAKKKKSGKNN